MAFIVSLLLVQAVGASHAFAPALLGMRRHIWFFWDDRGDDVTSEVSAEHETRDWVFEQTLSSWRSHNPGWNVTILNFDILPQFMNTSKVRSTMSVQAQSDMIRINVLNNHGGVWADASLACLQPLDDWVWPFIRREGYFMFGTICSWFIVSIPHSSLLTRWVAAADNYWETRTVASGNVGGTGDYRWLDGTLTEHLANDPAFADRFNSRVSMPCIGPCSPHMFYQDGCRDQVPASLSACVQECLDSDDLPAVAKLTMHEQCGYYGLGPQYTDSNGYHILDAAVGHTLAPTGGATGPIGGPSRPVHAPIANRTCIANSTCNEWPTFAACTAVYVDNYWLAGYICLCVLGLLLLSVACCMGGQPQGGAATEKTPLAAQQQ